MPRFFSAVLTDDTARIRGEDARHIAKSLRMRPGESLTVCDGGFEYDCVLEEVGPDAVTARILEKSPLRTEPNCRVVLFQCLPKSDKMERIVKQATELGVSTVVPVLSERCVARPDAKGRNSKVERYAKIALEAAKQSGRGIIPEVEPFMEFDAVPSRFAEFDTVLFCYEGGGLPPEDLAQRLRSSRRIAVVVGSEGGFSPGEAESAAAGGAVTVTLGPRILRAETAPLAALTAVMLLTGNLR